MRESLKRRVEALEARADTRRPIVIWAMTDKCERMSEEQIADYRETLRIPAHRPVITVSWQSPSS